MKQLTTVLLLLLFSLSGKSQDIDRSIEKFVAKAGIDTFMIYSFPCFGARIIDSCQIDDPQYLVWTKDGKTYIKKFGCHNTFKAIELANDNPLKFYFEHKDLIELEEIKPPAYTIFRKKGKKMISSIQTADISHPCIHRFKFPFYRSGRYKTARDFDLETESFFTGQINIYHSYNKRLQFTALIDQMTGLLDELHKSNRFKPD